MDTPVNGDNAASPPANDAPDTKEAAPVSTRDAMQARFADLERPDAPKGAKPSKPGPVAGKDAAKTKTAPDTPGKKGSEAEKNGADATKEGEGDDEKTLSVAEAKKFAQKRIDELTAKSNSAREKIAAKDLELGKAHEAIKLLSAEAERLRKALKEGKAYDPRDEELTTLRLTESARSAARTVEEAHQKRVNEAVQQEQFGTLRDQLAAELTDALAAHTLVHRSEVIEAAKTDPRPLLEVAAEIEARKLEIARTRLGVAAPAQAQQRTLPTTIVSRPGGHVRKQHPPNKAGMQARFDELIAGGR